jgi:hypothetical protein
LIDSLEDVVEDFLVIGQVGRGANVIQRLADCIHDEASRVTKQQISHLRLLEEAAHTRQTSSREERH